MSDDCLFCKIIEGEIDSYRVFENDSAFAFLDANPATRGHTLVVPKEHAETLTDLSASSTGKLFESVREVAEAVEEAMEPAGFNLMQNNGKEANQEIGHAHVHIIPRYKDDNIDYEVENGSLDEQDPEKITDKIRENIIS